MSELRETRKLNGLCVQCGAIMDREGIYCTRCNNANNISKDNYTQTLHSQGKCVDCGEILDREGWFCKTCVKKSNAKARERHAERRAKGLCVQCAMPIIEGTYCRRCLDQRMDRYWRKKGM